MGDRREDLYGDIYSTLLQCFDSEELIDSCIPLILFGAGRCNMSVQESSARLSARYAGHLRKKVANLLKTRTGSRGIFRDADLTGDDLTGVNLTGAKLAGANLTGANLTDAKLAGANLTGANLTKANLADADLTGANLTDTDLTGAKLTGALID